VVELETESVDVPDPPLTEVGLSERVSPVTEPILSVTVPEKPFSGAIVIVEVFADPPEVTIKLVGLAETVKSQTVRLAVPELAALLLSPGYDALTVTEPAVTPVTVTEQVPLLDREQVDAEKVTVPVPD
jgi:hypothetical protein